MENFNYVSPTYIAFGKGKEEEVGHLTQLYQGSKVLIVYGGGSVVRSGLLERIECRLEESGLDYVLFGGVSPNPLSGKVYEGIQTGKEHGCDFILAVGGGSVIDTAKAIAAGMCYEGDYWDFFEGKEVTKALPIGVVLTIAASGSEGSPDAVITRECDKKKTAAGGEVLRPKFSIMNPELTVTLPMYQTVSGVADIISHVLERYFTKTSHVEMTDRMCEGVLKGMIRAGRQVVKSPENYDVRANIMWGGYVAHNDILGVGRIQDWGTHHLEHELSALFGCTHGAALAVLIPHWMRAAMKEDGMRFAQLAVNVWGCEMNFDAPEETALEGIREFAQFFKEIGLPTSLGEFGIKETDINRIVDNLFHTAPTHGRFFDITRERARDIYMQAL